MHARWRHSERQPGRAMPATSCEGDIAPTSSARAVEGWVGVEQGSGERLSRAAGPRCLPPVPVPPTRGDGGGGHPDPPEEGQGSLEVHNVPDSGCSAFMGSGSRQAVGGGGGRPAQPLRAAQLKRRAIAIAAAGRPAASACSPAYGKETATWTHSSSPSLYSCAGRGGMGRGQDGRTARSGGEPAAGQPGEGHTGKRVCCSRGLARARYVAGA